MDSTYIIKNIHSKKPYIKYIYSFLLILCTVVVITLLFIQGYFAMAFISVMWIGALSTIILSIRTQLIILWALLPFIDLLKRIVYLDPNTTSTHAYLVLATVDVILLTILVKDILFSIQKPIRFHLNAIDISVILFGLYSFISAIYISNAPLIAKFATIGMWIWPMVSYFLYGKYFKSKDSIYKLVKLLLVLGLLVAIYGINQFYFGLLPFETAWFQNANFSENVSSLQAYFVKRGVFRTFGPMDSHSSYGIFLGLSLIITWILKPYLKSKIWIILSIIISFGLLLSFTRFTYIMPIIAAIFIFIFTYYRINPLINLHKIRRSSWLLLGVVCSFFIFYIIMDFLYGNTFIPSFNNPYIKRVFGTGTLAARLRLEDFFSVLSIQNPFGNGLANSTFFAKKFAFTSSDVNYHNIFLDMVGSMGILSILIFLSFMYFLFKISLMKIRIENDINNRRLLVGLFCLILAMLTVGHFNGAVYYFGRAIPIYFWAICGILAKCKLEKPSSAINIQTPSTYFN